ncbi:hypothetical protein D3C78_1780430 [compost metagenome]
MQLPEEGLAVDPGKGSVKNPPAAISDYGAVAYNYDAGTQYYVLYAMGKKGKEAIITSAISNAGQ